MIGLRVFLGPSLRTSVASAILPAQYSPPASFDAWNDAVSGMRMVVLIDGVFAESSAVTTTQILRSIESGTTVIGAASMGALRAVELESLGMLGFGSIYRAFRDRTLQREEELYVLYHPETFMPLTLPSINVRRALALALANSVLDRMAAILILDAALDMYFEDRTWQGVLAAVQDRLSVEVIGRFMDFLSRTAGTWDAKAADASRALRVAARLVAGPSAVLGR